MKYLWAVTGRNNTHPRVLTLCQDTELSEAGSLSSVFARVPVLLCGSKGTFKEKARSAEPNKGVRIMRCELQGNIWKAYTFPKGKILKEQANRQNNRYKHYHHTETKYKTDMIFKV